MDVNVRSSALAWIAALGLLALLAAPWILRFVQERFPPAGTLLPPELRIPSWGEEGGRHWNGLDSKVRSNTATEEEIREYYEHRRKMSEDLVTFTRLVLEEYGAELPEAERGLYERSLRMHHTRLEKLAQQARTALDRRRLQELPSSGLPTDPRP
jgi:hypothetical protein